MKHEWSIAFGVCLLLFPVLSGLCHAAEPTSLWQREQLKFSGYSWDVKSGYYSPGKNRWDARNAWVDETGRLHLRMDRQQDRWRCSEIASSQVFGYGLYRFHVIGPIDRLDKQAVFGLFLYPGPRLPYQHDQEIDIEFARWGRESPPGNYTVTPINRNFSFQLQGSYTTHEILWLPDRIEFTSYHGHSDFSEQTRISHWTYLRDRDHYPKPPLQVHINYWLADGKAPADEIQPEVIVSEFVYHPWEPT